MLQKFVINRYIVIFYGIYLQNVSLQGKTAKAIGLSTKIFTPEFPILGAISHGSTRPKGNGQVSPRGSHLHDHGIPCAQLN